MTISPDGFGTEGTSGLIAVFKLHPQMSHIQSCGNFVLQEGTLHRLAVGIVLDIFHQRMADPLYNAALGLNACQRRIDGDAAIHHSHIDSEIARPVSLSSSISTMPTI